MMMVGGVWVNMNGAVKEQRYSTNTKKHANNEVEEEEEEKGVDDVCSLGQSGRRLE